ncbi:MAG: hypothetical protein BRC36_12240 [Cyanobacteria bacterium QH_2_48_84]|nr:MAG: hypothetical protein BRC36_12240 [Cyanobacteria bacterium QH_2_48_84]
MNDSEILAEVRRWMRFAQEDLATAQALINLPDYVPRNVCYLSQQAVEKALKAALIFARVRYLRSHDLNALRELLPPGWQVKPEHPDLAALSH